MKKMWVNITKTKKQNQSTQFLFHNPSIFATREQAFFVNNKIKFKIDTVDITSS